MIFVFGSNLAGRHGAGAALYARRFNGAEYGVGEGITGNSYALPTKSENLLTLSLPAIKRHVDNFLVYAMSHPEKQFQVTQIGCGLAGYKAEEIAPMFEKAPENCLFDEAWKPYLSGEREFWGNI